MTKMDKELKRQIRESLETWAAHFVSEAMTYLVGEVEYVHPSDQKEEARKILDIITSSAEAALAGEKAIDEIEAYATLLRHGETVSLGFGGGTTEAAEVVITGHVFDDSPIIAGAYLSEEDAEAAIARSKAARHILKQGADGSLYAEALDARRPDEEYILGKAVFRPFEKFPTLDEYMAEEK